MKAFITSAAGLLLLLAATPKQDAHAPLSSEQPGPLSIADASALMKELLKPFNRIDQHPTMTMFEKAQARSNAEKNAIRRLNELRESGRLDEQSFDAMIDTLRNRCDQIQPLKWQT